MNISVSVQHFIKKYAPTRNRALFPLKLLEKRFPVSNARFLLNLRGLTIETGRSKILLSRRQTDKWEKPCFGKKQQLADRSGSPVLECPKRRFLRKRDRLD